MSKRNANVTRRTFEAQRELNTFLHQSIIKQTELAGVLAREIHLMASFREGVEAALFALKYAMNETPGFNTEALNAALCVVLASPSEGTHVAAFRRPLEMLFEPLEDSKKDALQELDTKDSAAPGERQEVAAGV